jgi:DEP domain-containing protein 5
VSTEALWADWLTLFSPKEAEKRNKRRILSQSMIIDVDPQKKSSQSETAILHYDIIQNPATAFHFQLHWVGTSAKFIDDNIQTWSRAVERYGLRIVEAYVDQVTDITKTNVFQSCYPIQFVVPPPALPPNSGVQPDYFEGCLLKQCNYVPDISSSRYYNQVDVYYSYRNSEFGYSQYVHKSGLAFAQIREGTGFSWLTNRLATIRHITTDGHASSSQERPNMIMDELNSFCQDAHRLTAFWDASLQALNAKLEAATAALVPVPLA